MTYKKDEHPEITVVVVNKRISQRFFVKSESGRLSNPPSGCIIDKGLVESHGEEKKVFDFYLTPASTTQGCILPTHFFVPKNDSKLTSHEIKHLTYALCHFYSNWAGPIKVPAPCQYAHKIADFYLNIGANKKGAASQPGREQKAVLQQVEQEVAALSSRLHFL